MQLNGSDLHLKVGAPPAARVRGLLDYLVGYEVLRTVDTEERLKGIVPEKLVEEFEEDGEADFSYAVQGMGHFRVNAFRQRGSVSLVMRFIPFGVPRFEDLGLAGVIGTLAREERGIILVTGTDDGERQVHDARFYVGPGQPYRPQAHRDDRGSDRVFAPRLERRVDQG